MRFQRLQPRLRQWPRPSRYISQTTSKVETEAVNTSLTKKERLCGKTAISRLLDEGRHGSAGNIRFLFLAGTGEENNRIMVSVPKKNFKRAVKRNLLKRRIRESWRKQKHMLSSRSGMDILFMYPSKEIMSYEDIYAAVGKVIESLNARCSSGDSVELS